MAWDGMAWSRPGLVYTAVVLDIYTILHYNTLHLPSTYLTLLLLLHYITYTARDAAKVGSRQSIVGAWCLVLGAWYWRPPGSALGSMDGTRV